MSENDKQSEPVAWRINFGNGFHSAWADGKPSEKVLNHWLKQGRKLDFAYTHPAPAVAVNDDLAKAVHYPDCWDVAAYPTLADALRELATCFQCCECVKNPTVAVNEQMLNALKLYIAHAGEPECAIWRHVQAKVKAAIAAAETTKKGCV